MSSPAGHYLDGLPADLAARLADVNQDGVLALGEYLGGDDAVAFLGAGVSAPLYPLWTEVVHQLIAAAVERGLWPGAAKTCAREAAAYPDAVVELIRQDVGPADYHAVLREVFRVRRDPDSGRSWTETQELVCRCAFKAIVTTNFDRGVVDARTRVRPGVADTGFTSWTDELALDRWRTGDVFRSKDELPILYAHGHHNQPDAMVLAAADYQRAYAGKLSRVLEQMTDAWHLVWLGFSFGDQRIAAVLREVSARSGTRAWPGAEPRHVAVMAFDPDDGRDPATVARLARINYHAKPVLYPAPNADHSALHRLLAPFTDARFPAAPALADQVPEIAPDVVVVSTVAAAPASTGAMPPPASTAAMPPPAATQAPAETAAPPRPAVPTQVPPGPPAAGSPAPPATQRPVPPPAPAQAPPQRRLRRRGEAAPLSVRWVHGPGSAKSFVGRVEELARLNRWAADPGVRLIAVSAWGGAGKTALVSHWLDQANGAAHRPVLRGIFAWSFYTNPNPEAWARTLLGWAATAFRIDTGPGSLAEQLIRLLGRIPVALVLDGLEVVQEGPASDGYGRLMDGLLREVLTEVCRLHCSSLVVLTSRFPFADLAGFDGATARMLDVPPFTPAEGAALLAEAGATGLSEQRRRDLVAEVDGHALAVSAMAVLLATHPDAATASDLLAHVGVGATGTKVLRVLAFYADRLSPTQRSLAAAVSLFTRPVTPAQLEAVAGDDEFGGRLAGLTADGVRAMAEGPLAGLLTWHPDGTVSAHPLVRATFRPLALGAAQVAAEVSLTDSPAGPVTSREQAMLLLEAVELLLDAGQWTAADNLYQARTRVHNVSVWQSLPAARLGQRAATAFVGTPERRQACATELPGTRLGWYLNDAGLLAMIAGDLVTAQAHLDQAIAHRRTNANTGNLSIGLQNKAICLGYQGRVTAARAAADEASVYVPVGTRGHTTKVFSQACLAWTSDLVGDTLAAESYFIAANRLEHEASGDNLSSVWGVWWGAFLARTGRAEVAKRLTRTNLLTCELHEWNEDSARCQVLLARLELAAGRASAAGPRLTEAIALLRGGDYLVELADALTVLGEHARLTIDFDAAERCAAEALSIAVPRDLRPIEASALALRARVAARRISSARNPTAEDAAHLARGRDAADAALRLGGVGPPHLPWSQLEALAAHAALDRAERQDRGWAQSAVLLRQFLVPGGLDANPLIREAR